VTYKDAAAMADTKTTSPTNGASGAATQRADAAATPIQLDPAAARRVAQVRALVRESFGKIAMAMMLLPRYRHQSIGDLQHLILEPLIRDRIAIAYPGGTPEDQSPLADMTGVAIWASVSPAVDAAIREQIKSGTFPIRLKADDWTSGEINWLLDVLAADAKSSAQVVANFKQVLVKPGSKSDGKGGSLRLHPVVSAMLDDETLKALGAERMSGAAS
jgi:cytolysin-activating lysine-acyltransferase